MKMTHLDIIDPIHDFVRVYDNELKIIDTSIFQAKKNTPAFRCSFDLPRGAAHQI